MEPTSPASPRSALPFTEERPTMSALRRFSFALTGIVTLSLLLVLSAADQERAAGAPPSSPQNVVVVNTTTSPVPTPAH